MTVRSAGNTDTPLQPSFSAGQESCHLEEHKRAATLQDWADLHGLDLGDLDDCLAVLENSTSLFDLAEVDSSAGHDDRTMSYQAKDQLTEALNVVVRPALAVLFEGYDLGPLIDAIKWGAIDDGEMACPHTVYHGVNQAPEIRMAWAGSPSDLICLAHEVAHAIQLQLSAGSFMPPVARETCAFLGELALIQWARLNDAELASELLRVWREENAQYFGGDCEVLRTGLSDPKSLYSYQMNYPLARAAAVFIWRAGGDIQRLFQSGSEAMAILPVAKIADIAALTYNYLSPLPSPDTAQPAIDAYRALGAIALLDIDFWKGDSERIIEDYYATLLHHLQNRTAFVALDDVRRPVGYATWKRADSDNAVTLTRQAAPFGDHLLLQKALKRHLGQETDVQAQHPRSARQEQVAW